MLRVEISVPCGLGVLLSRVSSPGREGVMGEGLLCRAAFHRVPGGSTADVREPGAGLWAAVAHLGVLEEGHYGAVPGAGASFGG